MDLLKALKNYYYEMSLDELKWMNENELYPTISYNSLLYLDVISFTENCTVSLLAKRLHISKSAVTMKINELIKLGFVQKSQSQEDKRIFYLTVSPEMEEDYQNYSDRFLQAAKLLENTYSKEDISLFCDMLSTLKAGYLQGAITHDKQ